MSGFKQAQTAAREAGVIISALDRIITDLRPAMLKRPSGEHVPHQFPSDFLRYIYDSRLDVVYFQPDEMRAILRGMSWEHYIHEDGFPVYPLSVQGWIHYFTAST